MSEVEVEKKVRVRFTRRCSPYTVGEIASFMPFVANKLKTAGVCEFIKGDDDGDNQPNAVDGERPGARTAGTAEPRAKKDKPSKGRVRVR
jgi:hypothetical protein